MARQCEPPSACSARHERHVTGAYEGAGCTGSKRAFSAQRNHRTAVDEAGLGGSFPPAPAVCKPEENRVELLASTTLHAPVRCFDGTKQDSRSEYLFRVPYRGMHQLTQRGRQFYGLPIVRRLPLVALRCLHLIREVHEGRQQEQRVGPSQRTTSTSVGGTQMLVVRIHPRNSHV